MKETGRTARAASWVGTEASGLVLLLGGRLLLGGTGYLAWFSWRRAYSSAHRRVSSTPRSSRHSFSP